MTTLHHTDITPAAPADAAIFNAPLGQLDAAIDGDITNLANLIAGAQAFTQLNLGATATVTIATGAIAITRSVHLVDTEAAAATDDLDNITGGADGDLLFIRLANSAHQVRVRNLGGGTGNIRTANGLDVWLTSTDRVMMLLYNNVLGIWTQPLNEMSVKSVLDASATQFRDLIFPQKVVKATDGNNGKNAQIVHVMPRPSVRRHFGEVAANATWVADGMAAGTSAGAGALSALTGAQAPSDIFTNQTIAAVAATFGGRRSTTFNLVRRQHNPYFATLIRLRTAVTNLRVWAGLCQAQVTNADALAAGTAGFFFRFSTVFPDASWVAICNDGAAQSAAVASGAGAIAVDTDYLLELWVDSVAGIAYFSVNGGTPFTVNTNLPTTTQDLGWTVSAITTTATAKDIAIAQVYVERG